MTDAELADLARQARDHADANRFDPADDPFADATPDAVLLAYTELLADGDTEGATTALDTFQARHDPDPRPDPIPAKPAKQMADATAAVPAHVGENAKTAVTAAADTGEPASGEVALAGRDGAALARLIRASKAAGVKAFNAVVRDAIKTYRGTGPLLDAAALTRLADPLAAVTATAELTGRARVREMHERAETHGNLTTFADEPLASAGSDVIRTPAEALDYFTLLYPRIGVDPDRFPGEQRRRAFTLAASSNEVLTKRVQDAIAEGLRHNLTSGETQRRIADLLDASGATTRNPQYAEMVFRTNAMDSFQTGMWEEGRDPDVRDTFPVYQYLGINDDRAGNDHRPKFNKFYPAEAAFADVRGPRMQNCRCSLRWVDRFEWRDHVSRGANIEQRW